MDARGMVGMATKRWNRAQLDALLAGMGFEADGSDDDEFSGMTAAELRSLVEAGFVNLDGQAHESFDVSYFLGLMDETGALAGGRIDRYAGNPDFLLSIDRLDLPGGDARQQVKFLRRTLGCDEVYDLDDGGIGVWWD
jgi:hypothetical protein